MKATKTTTKAGNKILKATVPHISQRTIWDHININWISTTSKHGPMLDPPYGQEEFGEFVREK